MSCWARSSQRVFSLAGNHSLSSIPVWRSIYYRSSVSFYSTSQPLLLESKPPTSLTNNVNGPASTRPAPLDLPKQEPGESFIASMLKLGKAYLNFYKTGIKHVYTNYQQARTLHRKIQDEASGSIAQAIASNTLPRSDFQLLYRSRHDTRRIPAFLLLVAICGEFTPLVVVFFPNMVPWTCRIPRQIQKSREGREEARRTSFRNLTSSPPTPANATVERLSPDQLLHISRSLGLFNSRILESLGLRTTGMLRSAVARRIEYLEWDDTLVQKAGGTRGMELEEVRMALEERGVDVLGKDEARLRTTLAQWFAARAKSPLTTLLLTRPSIWTTRPSEDGG